MNMAGTLEHTAPETFPTIVTEEEEEVVPAATADGGGGGAVSAPRGDPTAIVIPGSRYGQAADLWALGAIFFQLLTGEV